MVVLAIARQVAAEPLEENLGEDLPDGMLDRQSLHGFA